MHLFVVCAIAFLIFGSGNSHTSPDWSKFIGLTLKWVNKKPCLDKVKNMFDFAYANYLQFAFPADELNPLNCSGRGHDHEHPGNLNVNDALGDFHLTLVDSLDTLAIMGRVEEFKNAVNMVISHLSFNRNVRVQVFEASIRILGGLLSAHLLVTDPAQPFGNLRLNGYDGELLQLAHDLANRMLNAFDCCYCQLPQASPSGLPYPRFNLGSGLKDNTTSEACLAGAGSLLLEFGCLSALLNDATYASISRRVVLDLWSRRSSVTGLLGATIDVNTGKWINRMSGIGAGHDSFYEYLHKTAVIFGDRQMGEMFEEALNTLRYHLRSLGSDCLTESGYPSVYWNVDMYTGNRVNFWIDTLQSAWSGVLVHHGDVSEAVCQHALHYFIWQLFDLPPEREHSSIFRIFTDRCGFATIHNVLDMSHEDRMESFFLSETLKYLYLLFDDSNPVNLNEEDYVFSTQAHLFPIQRIRKLIENLVPNPFRTDNSRTRMDLHVANNTFSGGYEDEIFTRQTLMKIYKRKELVYLFGIKSVRLRLPSTMKELSSE
ncbi:ER degradation enhancer, mannosidase alpha-like 1 [Paragonimus westermani]|uniref:alpha-1,2-Mannosidase n=1 Tax=Paragonimus westermani TaxID=34504 RepID=A0A5J4NA70_9TREM|nr:ER degradation enhancer, mannosidase alpha-like 1 [Paragonimus westermani]